MPTYILLSSLTPEGSQTLHKDPERLDAVNKEISEFGCKVVTQYAVLGGYDFVTIVDAPDNETVAHMSVDLSSRGTVKITTLPAIPVVELLTLDRGSGFVAFPRSGRKSLHRGSTPRVGQSQAFSAVRRRWVQPTRI